MYEAGFWTDALINSNEEVLADLEELAKTICQCFNGTNDEFCVGAVNDDGIFYPIDLLMKMAKDGNYLYTVHGNKDMAKNGFDYRLVSAVTLGKRKSHKGYKFRRINKEKLI